MMLIRRATVGDAELVEKLVRELAEHEGTLEEVRVDLKSWRALLDRPQVTVLIAEVDDAPAGFTSMVRRLHLWSGGDILALDDLFVRPAYRNAGVGGQLMSAVARIAATALWTPARYRRHLATNL